MTQLTDGAEPVRFAVSKAGHDKGTLYCILSETPDAFFLSDGRTRTVNRPKKKNKKHVQIIVRVPDEIAEECRQNGAFYNEGIRHALKMWSKRKEETETEQPFF